MSAPQRLNVLLSRARDAMIMFGSVETFKNARKGRETYGKFFEIMNGAGHMRVFLFFLTSPQRVG
jgi:hypothetical protein